MPLACVADISCHSPLLDMRYMIVGKSAPRASLATYSSSARAPGKLVNCSVRCICGQCDSNSLNIKDTIRLINVVYWAINHLILKIIFVRFFFACLFTETESRFTNSQKGTRPIYPVILTEQSLVNEGFIIWLLGKFSLQDTADSPEGAR